MRRHEVRRWLSSRDQQADLVAWQWGVVTVVRGVSREVRVFLGMSLFSARCARGASLFGHEMVPDSSSGAGARGVSAWAPSCEVMKQILDQSLGGAILFEHATNTLLPLSPLLLLPLPLFQRFKELL